MLLKVIKFYGRFLISFSRIGYVFRSLFWRRLRADFTGQHWIITGASGGIGEAIALGAAQRGAYILAIARNREKLDRTGATIPEDQWTPLCADLSLQADTEAVVRQIIDKGKKIDVLVNNVGIMLDDFSVTPEGHETTFAVNILNHYLLTERLIAARMFAKDAVIINMASGGMYNAPLMLSHMNWQSPKGYSGVFAYAVHKRGQAELTGYWQEKYGDNGQEDERGPRFYVMHPGWADTDGVKFSMPRFRKILKSVLRNSAQGADTAIWLAATRPPADVPAPFWFDRKPRSAHAYDRTRETQHTPQDLVDFLDAEIEKGKSHLAQDILAQPKSLQS